MTAPIRLRRGPAAIQFDLRVSAEAALAIDLHARKRRVMGHELVAQIVERVFEDDLVMAVLDDG